MPPKSLPVVDAKRQTTALFVTCLVDQFFPRVGEATVRLLERCGRTVEFPGAQTCCGQPAFNMGYSDEARQLARRWIEIFEPFDEVVTPSGSCASMARIHFPELLEDDPAWHTRARRLAPRVFELSEFLLQQGYDPASSSYTGQVTYHPSCHLLRELRSGDAPRVLLGGVPGVELVDLPDAAVCCGFGGAFSVKMPDLSGAMLNAKLDTAEATGATVLTATDCGCLMNLGGALQRRESALEVVHVAEILAS
ncbi:MAG: (Fe-S)-binding protein [Acidobacteriota bacterium]